MCRAIDDPGSRRRAIARPGQRQMEPVSATQRHDDAAADDNRMILHTHSASVMSSHCALLSHLIRSSSPARLVGTRGNRPKQAQGQGQAAREGSLDWAGVVDRLVSLAVLVACWGTKQRCLLVRAAGRPREQQQTGVRVVCVWTRLERSAAGRARSKMVEIHGWGGRAVPAQVPAVEVAAGHCRPLQAAAGRCIWSAVVCCAIRT